MLLCQYVLVEYNLNVITRPLGSVTQIPYCDVFVIIMTV